MLGIVNQLNISVTQALNGICIHPRLLDKGYVQTDFFEPLAENRRSDFGEMGVSAMLEVFKCGFGGTFCNLPARLIATDCNLLPSQLAIR